MMSAKHKEINSLLKIIEEKADDRQSILLLANLQRDCGFYAQAIRWYQERLKLDPVSHEECWYSLLQIAICKIRDKHSFKSITEDLMVAYNARPWRAESIYYLINYLRDQGSVVTAYWIGKTLGLFLANPIHDTLFIEKDIYDWKFYAEMRLCAWFSGQRHDSKEYYNRVMEHGFNDEDRAEIEKNLTLN